MKLKICQNVVPDQWDAQVVRLGGIICQSSGWAEYNLKANPNAAAWFINLIDDDGRVKGAAIGYFEKSHHKLLAPLTGRLYLDALPAVENNDQELFRQFIQLLEKQAKHSGIVELAIDSFASYGGKELWKNLGFELSPRMEFELSLEKPEDDIWQGLEYKRRKNIRKAERLNVTVRDLPGDEGIEALRNLQGDSSRRITQRGGPDINYTGNIENDPVRVLLKLGMGRIVGAEVEGEIVSAGLFTCFNNLVYHTLSGHSNEALKTQAPTFLLWETIKRYRRQDARRFNFGGCKTGAQNEGSPEHGVYVYKMGFGGQCLECTSGRKVLRKTAYNLVKLLKKILRH